MRSNDGEVVQSRALSRRCVAGEGEHGSDRAGEGEHGSDRAGEGTPSKIRAKARKDFSK